MLDCCIPTELVRKQGINFDEFICLAGCNLLETQAKRIDDSSSEEEFRNLLKEVTQKEDTFLILSYSRPVLGQTGDGHFAPVSGYHPQRDLVLILDTARFKYPPHWISVPLLFKSMKAVDKSTGTSCSSLPNHYICIACMYGWVGGNLYFSNFRLVKSEFLHFQMGSNFVLV